ncbi:hypothetical protein T3H00_22405 [Pseudomonas fluorescens]|uniref:hypothetical protein n=1 Tax=Pseudomonas fluorescens TaxID=294 RepID=UPI002ACA5EAB|nr:hypothetical protein [Pseudomonas fluorescens]MDZ5435400.1 hypothetical protein [Pseudomonas fluorescens]
MKKNEFSLYSEPYSPSGNIGDGGLKKLLGAPTLSLLQAVIREAIQNSCDAVLSDQNPRIKFRLRTLTNSQSQTLKKLLITLPEQQNSKNQIDNFLNSPSPRVLEICDYNTEGLTGPTRADQIPENAQETNFIEFMRNFGSNRNKEYGGGTYGFGKVSLYRASMCSTILVDSQTTYNDSPTRRLIGCHLGDSFQATSTGKTYKKYTGRHWWGIKDENSPDGFVDPVEGSSATEICDSLGLPERNEQNPGTTILIFDPYLPDKNIEVVKATLIETLLWFFWPRLTKDVSQTKKLELTLEIDGVSVEIPKPENFPPLDLFCRALTKVRTKSNDSEVIVCKSPKKHLGRIAIEKGFKAIRHTVLDETTTLFPSISSHIAVMRPVELVVKYYKGDALPDGNYEWAGVFVADSDKEVEEAFAKSEPPAHDDWEPSMMEPGRQKTFVRVAVRDIKSKAKSIAAPAQIIDHSSAEGDSLALAADTLGMMLASKTGQGAGPLRTPKRETKLTTNTVSTPISDSLYIKDGYRVAIFKTVVRRVELTSKLSLVIDSSVALDGAFPRKTEEKTGPEPEVLFITTADNAKIHQGNTARIGCNTGTYYIHVKVPNDCGTMLKAYLVGGSE